MLFIIAIKEEEQQISTKHKKLPWLLREVQAIPHKIQIINVSLDCLSDY